MFIKIQIILFLNLSSTKCTFIYNFYAFIYTWMVYLDCKLWIISFNKKEKTSEIAELKQKSVVLIFIWWKSYSHFG